MPAAPIAPHLRAFAPEFARCFGVIAASLVATVARLFLRDPTLAPLIIPLCTRFSRAARRCSRLMTLVASGKLPRHRRSRHRNETDTLAPASPVDVPAPAPRKRALSPIPTTEAWLIRTLRQEVGGYRSQLAHLLANPATPDLLAAAPTAAHFLRPICRLLGLPLPKPAPRPGIEPSPIQAANAPPQPPPPRPQRHRHPIWPGPRPETIPSSALADDLPWIIDRFPKPA